MARRRKGRAGYRRRTNYMGNRRPRRRARRGGGRKRMLRAGKIGFRL